MSGIVIACLLLCLGLYGVMTRREIVAVLASVEVMLGGATLLLVVLASSFGSPGASVAGARMAASGQALALLVLAMAAAEAAVALALLVALVTRGRARTDEIMEVRG